jgi:hypothetical protein
MHILFCNFLLCAFVLFCSQDQAPYFGERHKNEFISPLPMTNGGKITKCCASPWWKIADSELKWASNKTNEMPLETHAFTFGSRTREHIQNFIFIPGETVVYIHAAIGRATWQKNKLATPHTELHAQDSSKSFGAAHGAARLTSSLSLQLGKGERVCVRQQCAYLLRALPPLLSERESVSAVGLTWATNQTSRGATQMGWKHILIGGGRAHLSMLIKKRPPRPASWTRYRL